jgi:hypothetical protein
MATLTIDVGDSPLGAMNVDGNGLPLAYVARVARIREQSGTPLTVGDRREIILRLGRPVMLDVEPGLWSVELVLPSGELLNEQVRLEEGGAAPVHFTMGNPPHEGLAWQFAEGSLPERELYEVAAYGAGSAIAGARAVARNRAVPFRTTENLRKALGSPVVVTDSFARPSVFTTKRNRSQVTVLRYFRDREPEGADAAAKFRRSLGLWKALVAGLRLERPILEMAGLRKDEVLSFVPGPGDPWHDVWRLGPDGEATTRRFAMVATNNSVELVSLPLPWYPNAETVDGALLELVIDKGEVAERSRSSVTLRDQRFFGLLSYLKSGSLALAATVAQRGAEEDNLLVDILQEKRRSPLAAAAAGYALLGSIDLKEPQRWYPWLANLSEWFPWMPDGAILHGRWLTRSGQDSDGAARRAFLRAFRRGLPFYSLGLNWLLEGLRQYEDGECVEAARVVRQVALRCDVDQVFTVLRLHAMADQPASGGK